MQFVIQMARMVGELSCLVMPAVAVVGVIDLVGRSRSAMNVVSLDTLLVNAV